MNKNENRAADNFGSPVFPKRTGGFFMQANSQKRRARKTALEFAGYVAPAVFFITLFVGIPFVRCIYYSFRKWNGIGKTSEFVGLENYIRLFTNDPAFVSALKYTFIYAIGTVLIVNVLAIFFAALLESKIKGRGFFRALLYSQYHKPCYHWIYLEIYLYQSI